MRLEDSILIDAPPPIVWAVTMDICAWPDWAPTISSVRKLTPGAIGRSSRFLVRQPLQKAAVWTITELDPGCRLAWERARGGTTIRATHVVEGAGPRTLSTLVLETSGLRMPVVPVLRLALRAENAGLKRACERLAGPPAA